MGRTDISQEQRRSIYHRDGFACRRCGRGTDLTVHHRKNRSQGGKNEGPNLVTLCGSGTTGCHGWVGANPRIGYALGWLVPSWANPAEWPVRMGEGHWSQPKDFEWMKLDQGTEWQTDELEAIEGGRRG